MEDITVTLVGESNPYGGDPYFALYPAPDGCSGERLCRLVLGMRRDDYLEAFQRENLCVGKWSMPAARAKAKSLWEQASGRYILCGTKVASAWEVPYEPLRVFDGGTTLVLPHPSGLCRFWNSPDAFLRARAAAADFLADVPAIARLIGKAAN